jgi:iron complex outermembrane receptor protein
MRFPVYAVYFQGLACVTLPTFCLCQALSSEPGPPLQEVIVTATLRPIAALEVPASVTVLDAKLLQDAGQEDFEDVAALVPNLNWAGDTSRPRYFQIRGIGELEQYQGAPNPSVGFLIDDIDFSGLGGAATLFDVDQIDVLRGPQGTRYGANALGGLIYAKSADPGATFGGRIELGAGDYGAESVGAVVTGPVAALDSGFRLAVQHYRDNGYYYNAYLNRDDVDRHGELTLRGKWRYQPTERLRIDVTLLHVQLDNGYDAWSIDNSRTTESDQPSVDSQHSTGASIRLDYTDVGPATLTILSSYGETRVKYGFDGDWGNPILWAPYTYDFTDVQTRDRTTQSFEVRLGTAGDHGLTWLIGLYAQQLHESLAETSAGLYIDPFAPADNSDTLALTTSRYQSRNGAVFGELAGDLSPRLRWSLGLRGERRTTTYHDLTTNLDAPSTSNNFNPANDLWGGDVSLTYALAPGESAYLLLARGYKAGGFNLSAGLPVNEILFNPESDLNTELGYKADLFDRRVHINADIFYMQRHAPQLVTGVQLVADNPDTFVYYTGNASSGVNYGLESEVEWQATRSLELGASLGLLQTLYRGFIQNNIVLPDRELPNAPHWQAAVHATWRDARGLFARLEATGMGSYYFDMPPNWTTSNAYGLVNGKLGWEASSWSAYLWGRNLFDKNYPVRGFYFGDVPPNFPNQFFRQLGEPRVWGVNFTYSFR